MNRDHVIKDLNEDEDYHPFILNEGEMKALNEILYNNGVIARNNKDAISFFDKKKLTQIAELIENGIEDYPILTDVLEEIKKGAYFFVNEKILSEY